MGQVVFWPDSPAQIANKIIEGLTEAQIIQAQFNALAQLLFEAGVIRTADYNELLRRELMIAALAVAVPE